MINSSATQPHGPNRLDHTCTARRRHGSSRPRVPGNHGGSGACGLLFVFRFPGSAGDSEIYLQFARNLGRPSCLWILARRPFPFRRTSECPDTRPSWPEWLCYLDAPYGQFCCLRPSLDVVTCFLTAALAAALAPAGSRRRVWIIAACGSPQPAHLWRITRPSCSPRCWSLFWPRRPCTVLRMGLRQEPQQLNLRDARKRAHAIRVRLAWMRS